MQSETQFRPTELRYRIADFINDRLKSLPAVHAGARAAVASLLGGKSAQPNADTVAPAAQVHSNPPEQPADVAKQNAKAGEPATSPQPISLDNLPIPPLEMRELVGTTAVGAYDNPRRELLFHYLDPALSEAIFDFGCGCGRMARQLMLQRPIPKLYVGVDLHAGMIRWCQRNLQPAAPQFSFFHHDVYNPRFNPNPRRPSVAAFPVADSQFSLVNAISVFTHLTQEQAVHYLRECARILTPTGIVHASWFFFDKKDYPMLQPDTNALYVSYVDPSAAVIFDREWVRATARQFGLRICSIVPPEVHGHQWLVMMTKREDVEEPEFPADTAAPRAWPAPRGSQFDLSKIGLESK